jgi:hypothetical protein
VNLYKLAEGIADDAHWHGANWYRQNKYPNLVGRWVACTVSSPVARVRFRNNWLMGYGMSVLVRIDGDGWMIDIFKCRVKQTRGNRDRMMEDLIALRMSM